MVNVALAGTWHVHFWGYANAVANNPDCRITALWDPDEKTGGEASEKLLAVEMVQQMQKAIMLMQMQATTMATLVLARLLSRMSRHHLM